MKKMIAKIWLALVGSITLIGLLSEPITRLVLGVIAVVVMTAWAVCVFLEP